MSAHLFADGVSAALSATHDWPVDHLAVGVIDPSGTVSTIGDRQRRFEVASLTKPVVALGVLVAVEERAVDLDEPFPGAQAGCTLRHLLAHTGGYPFDSEHPVARPGTARIYSNAGFEIIDAGLSRLAGIDTATYLHEAVFEPLAMDRTTLDGSAAGGLVSCVDDLLAFCAELLSPTLIDTATRNDALMPQWPDLAGIVPGVGRFEPCPWGLGLEIAGDKAPHWMGRRRSARTAGHFGANGSMMWIDPSRSLGLVALGDRPFRTWAADAVRSWAALSDSIVDAVDAPHGGPTR